MRKGFRIIKFKKHKPIFKVKDVSKSYDGRPILQKINITSKTVNSRLVTVLPLLVLLNFYVIPNFKFK